MSSSPRGGALRRTVNKTQVGLLVLPNTLEDSQHCGEWEVGPAWRLTGHLHWTLPPAGMESVGGLSPPGEPVRSWIPAQARKALLLPKQSCEACLQNWAKSCLSRIQARNLGDLSHSSSTFYLLL